MYETATTGGLFIASAMNRTNADENRDKWIGTTQDGHSVTANLYEFV